MNADFALSTEKAGDYKKSWGTCNSNDLPDLFSAYHEADAIAKRVTAYILQKPFLEDSETLNNATVQIHMACDPNLHRDIINDEPRFFPILCFNLSASGKENLYFRMKWDKEYFDRNPSSTNEGDASIGIPIKKETLHELLTGWCICKHQDLSSPFEGLYHHLQQRVVHYDFKKDSENIITEMMKPKNTYVRVIMGVGHPFQNNNHPFSFRPIIQIGADPEILKANDEDTCQFEFSTPCPPGCGQ